MCLVLISSGCSRAANPAPSSLTTNRQTRLPRKSLVSRLPCHDSGMCRPLTTSSPQYFGLPGFSPGKMRIGAHGPEVRGPGDAIVDPLAPGAVGRERLAPAVEMMPPGIDQPPDEDLQPHRLGPELPDPAAAQPSDAVRRLDVAMDIDRLVEVEHPVVAPPQRVEDVVGILGAEAREHDAGLVGLAVAVGVLEVEQLGAVGDVRTAVARLDAGGDQQAAGEDRGLVGPAVAVAVLDDEDLVVGDLPRLDLRIDLRAGDPEPAGGVEVHLDRLGDDRVGREQVDLEAVGHDERLALDLRVGIGDREGCPLPVGAGDRHQHDDRRGEYEVSHQAILGDEVGAFKAFGAGLTLAAESDPVPLPEDRHFRMGPGTTTDRELGLGAVSLV